MSPEKTRTFLILKYGSMANAYDAMRDGDLRSDYDLFTTVQRHEMLDWYYRFVQQEHNY